MGITTLFVGAIFVSLFIGSLFNPLMGIWGYLCVYLIYNPSLWWAAPLKSVLSRFSLVAVIFLVAGCFLHFGKLNKKISWSEIEIYLFVGVMCIVSIVFGVEMHQEAWMALEKMAKTMVFIFLMIRVVHRLDHFKTVIWCIILAGVFMAFQGHEIGQYIGTRLENIGGLDFREANSLSLFMGCGCVFLSFEFLRARWWGKLLAIPGIAMMLDILILTRSRAGFLGIVLTVPYIVFAIPKRYRKQTYASIMLGAILLFFLADKYFIDRMYTIKDEAQVIQIDPYGIQKETLSRWDFWKTSIPIFRDHPLGIGVRNFQRIVSTYDPRNPGMDAHNTYIICYTEVGIVGFFLFLMIICRALIKLRMISIKAKKESLTGDVDLYAVGLFSSLIIYLLGGMTTHTYLYHEITWILFALTICLENATKNISNSLKV